MTDEQKIKNTIVSGEFIKNNGEILRILNILGHKFHKLTSIESVLSQRGISEEAFIEAVNFLNEEKYIALRLIASKELSNLADSEYTELEAKLSGKGLRLLNGGISDNMVEV